MLYDVRTYACRPGTIKKHQALYLEYGFEVQKRHLGEPLVYLLTDTGDVNSYLHIWVYQNAADRETRRAAMMRDPQWLDYLGKSADAGYLIKQENRLMVRAPFFQPPAP
jgi:hypothetical protein